MIADELQLGKICPIGQHHVLGAHLPSPPTYPNEMGKLRIESTRQLLANGIVSGRADLVIKAEIAWTIVEEVNNLNLADKSKRLMDYARYYK